MWVEILPPEKYETVISEYIFSENYLLDGKCPDSPKPHIFNVKKAEVPILLNELEEKRLRLYLRQEGFLRDEQMREELRKRERIESTG